MKCLKTNILRISSNISTLWQNPNQHTDILTILKGSERQKTSSQEAYSQALTCIVV